MSCNDEGLGRTAPRVARTTLASCYLVFLFSGVASLICEVVWFKQLQFVVGGSTLAVSIVVASFFTGLAIGSFVLGRRADHARGLLSYYAKLEFCLALVSASVTVILSQSSQWIGLFAPLLAVDSPIRTPTMLLVSAGLLLPPTVLMGATLPVLTKYVVRRQQDLARQIGMLYGLNTLGASIGCFVTGFFLIGYFGVVQSGLIASAIYLLVSIVAKVASVRYDAVAETLSALASSASGIQNQSVTRWRYGGLAVVVGLMGFTAISYEVLWFRLLTTFSIQSVYAFSGMLSTYLLGLVFGSVICSRLLASKKELLFVYFARLQLLIAVAGGFSLALLGRSRNILHVVDSFEHWAGIADTMFYAFSGVSGFLVLCIVVLLIPATLIGIAFPLVTELSITRLHRLGTGVGVLYALSTIGGVFGALLTGFVLLPFLGSQSSFLLIIAVTLSLFLLTALANYALRVNFTLWREAAVTLAVLAVGFGILGPDYLMRAQTAFVDASVLEFRESEDATFVVLGYESAITENFQQVIVNGKSYANNSPPGRRYMSALAHLPALIHPNPRSAVVIAMGTGTTVGCLTLHPSIEEIWAVDIAKDVFDIAHHFVPLNHDFLNNPKVRPIVADGRHFLLTSEDRFDVLTFEPPPPHDAGIVNLYSRDFYRIANERLNEDGIVCQWVPLDMPRESLHKMLVKSMMDVFPHVSLWIPNRCEGIAIASRNPLSIDVQRLGERLSNPALQEDVAAYGLSGPEQWLATFVACDDVLARYIGDASPVTDNRPRVEYFNQYRPRRFRYDDLKPFVQRIDPILSRPLRDSSEFGAARRVVFDIWYAHELREIGQFAKALERLRFAEQLDESNAYLRYLISRLERDLRDQQAGNQSKAVAMSSRH